DVTGGLVAGDITGNGTGTVTATATLAKINATLANATGVAYRGVLDYNGADTLTVTANDNGNTGTGGALSDTRTVAITVNPVNDPPVVTVPGAQAVDEDTNLFVTGISVADVDAGGATNFQLTLSALPAPISSHPDVTGGLVAGDIAGNGTGSVTATAT